VKEKIRRLERFGAAPGSRINQNVTPFRLLTGAAAIVLQTIEITGDVDTTVGGEG
jgi:hypothetical protein